MLKDSFPIHQHPKENDLSIDPNFEVNKVLSFINKHIIGFPSYYHVVKDSEKENRISDMLVHHFEMCKNKLEGYFPFRFSKNPTQPNSNKETDIGVFVMTQNSKPITIIEFEAKRLSKTSNNKEYVYGERGGIERFKRGYHAPHLKICGMFGYVQSKSNTDWAQKINSWINERLENNTDSSIDWIDEKECLIEADSYPLVLKLFSSHFRKQSNDRISLWHYFINLLEKVTYDTKNIT